MSQFVAGFDIEGFGETLAEKLIQAGYNTLDLLLSASVDQIAVVYGFAEIMAKTIVEGLAENEKEMKYLVNSGIIQIKGIENGKLTGQSFCFTGELKTMKRQDAEKLVKDNGGQAKSSVTKDLTYLVTNDKNSGSSKNQKAEKLQIKIIDEDEFLTLING